ncbi:MAG: ParB/RepB/Spo0J family partition protein [Bacteroidales bacterium]|nr:ParB/RepB/Spo0J family partition protein [Bacteroidales bacterium]
MQQIQYIKTNQLHESSMNPRKEFHQESIDQLAESIKQVGILQPIIARLNPHLKKKAIPIYEVICGARRLSAAVIADLTEVPVIVRELSDEEAFDLMITENLQRKDVSPLEEALAYQKLIEKGTYDIDALCIRFGKNQTYIRQRLKLNDLLPEFKKLLSSEIIGIGHAMEICKLEAEYQTELYENSYSEEVRSARYWNAGTVKELKNHIEKQFTLKLSEATFDLADELLDKKAGACLSCPKNTASNFLLFPDSPQEGICLDRACFRNKSDKHFEIQLKHVQEEEPQIILGYSSYIYGEDEKRVKEQVKNGLPAVELSYSSGYSRISKPIEPDSPDREDYDSEEDYKDAVTDYAEEYSDYENDLKDYEEKLSSGKIRKAFIVAGSEKGSYQYYQKRDGNTDTSETGKQIGFKEQIKELQEKDKRNAEIAFEKTYNDAKELLSEKIYSNIESELTLTEWQAVYIVLLDYIRYVPLRDEIYPKGQQYLLNKEKPSIVSNLDANQINRLFRAFLQNKLDTQIYNISEANSLIQIATEYYPDEVKEIDLKHQGVYLNRKEKIESKIKELKNQ